MVGMPKLAAKIQPVVKYAQYVAMLPPSAPCQPRQRIQEGPQPPGEPLPKPLDAVAATCVRARISARGNAYPAAHSDCPAAIPHDRYSPCTRLHAASEN